MSTLYKGKLVRITEVCISYISVTCSVLTLGEAYLEVNGQAIHSRSKKTTQYIQNSLNLAIQYCWNSLKKYAQHLPPILNDFIPKKKNTQAFTIKLLRFCYSINCKRTRYINSYNRSKITQLILIYLFSHPAST